MNSDKVVSYFSILCLLFLFLFLFFCNVKNHIPEQFLCLPCDTVLSCFSYMSYKQYKSQCLILSNTFGRLSFNLFTKKNVSFYTPHFMYWFDFFSTPLFPYSDLKVVVSQCHSPVGHLIVSTHVFKFNTQG